jgi:signal transduction histidine kinase
MRIRNSLLIAFLIMALVPATLITRMAFVQSRGALQGEIERNLRIQAVTLMEQVDMMLFQHLLNMFDWSQLEIMQEARIGDVDKRLSEFLKELKTGQGGVYEHVFFTNQKGRIVAATDPSWIGQAYPQHPAWAKVELPVGQVLIDPLELNPPYTDARLRIRAQVDDIYTQGMLGNLYALFDWREIFRVFDQASGASPLVNQERMVALLDQEGRIIAASKPLRERTLLLSGKLASWRDNRGPQGVFTQDGGPLGVSEVLVGYARSQGYRGFRGLGWSLMVIEPSSLALAPIAWLGWAFLLFLILTAAVAGVMARMIAARISQPILKLTDVTRGFMRDGKISTPITVKGKDEVGELASAFAQMIDDLEHSREQLIRAAKLAVVGEMAAAMAHEVRTPLGILRSSAQMLQREPGLSPQGQEISGFVLSETDRLNRLITTLLECARPRPPSFQPREVQMILQRVLDLLAAQAWKKGVRLRTEYQVDAPVLLCDEEQLMQVFLNLVLNALQILPQGGEIVIRTRTEQDAFIVEVADNGPGISPENRQRVFDPFFTTREGGIGLGLTVVQQIVQAHGGTISLHSDELGGACFRVRLPLTMGATQ